MTALRYTDGERADDHADHWAARLGGRSETTRTLLVHDGAEERVARLAVGHPIWKTETIASKSGMRQRRTTKGNVAALRECQNGAIMALVDFGDHLERADAVTICVDSLAGAETWQTECPDAMGFDDRELERWVDVREQATETIKSVDSVSELDFEAIEGRGSRKTVNAFLEGHEDGTVDHGQGGVHHWKAAFVARYEGQIVAALVLAPPQNGQLAAAGEEIVISRIACHPSRPMNTSSWMISKARDWAERAGYARISALAGVDGNRGSCYKGAGFELDDVEHDYVDGNGNRWCKRRYINDLEPETYAGRDVPMPGQQPAAD